VAALPFFFSHLDTHQQPRIGPSKLPSLGKELGKTAKSFQTAAKEFEKELKSAAEEEAAEKKE
jgi:Sec-independent protein translocase protein TatA